VRLIRRMRVQMNIFRLSVANAVVQEQFPVHTSLSLRP
jgi:hypothetical protein